MTEFEIRVRSYLFRGVTLLAFAVLIFQLWNLQVVNLQQYETLADQNRLQQVPIPSPRGVIYDRNGELLVHNRPVYNVIIVPAFLPDDPTAQTKVFARLSELLTLPITTQVEPTTSRNNGYFHAINHHQYNRQIERQIINPRSRQFINEPLGIRDAVNQSPPFIPVTIAEDVDPIIVAKLDEERLDLPGVQIEIAPTRNYIYGELTSHMMGYVGPIPAGQFENYQALDYDLTDLIGLAGLEIEYEPWLRGVKGLESIEVDVTGQKIRTVAENIQARPGHNLRLTIDIELQEATAEALQEQMDEVGSEQGVAIAMNPKTGEILAMVSLPSYDNNIFSQGISARELALLNDDRWNPLVNHATAGLYPPGSIFKVIPASAALQERVVAPETTFVDEGVLYLPNQFEPDNLDLAQPFYGWLRTGLGEVNVVSALTVSSNIYFYYVGGGYPPIEYEGLGLSRIGQYAEMYGLGSPTGIDIPGELGGLVPNEKWKRLNYSEIWLTGDTYNMSVGQGFVLVTPLQMLNVYAAIANGGTLYKPRLVKEILDANGNLIKAVEPEVIGELALSPQNLQLIREGLYGVVNSDRGTARDTFDVPGLDASGKTGTAEFCEQYPQCLDRDGRVRTSHAWFASYAPSFNPEIVTIVFVYGGDEGSQTSVPVTNKILRHYFDQIEVEVESETEEEEFSEPETPRFTFSGRLLGTDVWPGDGAAISGAVFDMNEQPLSNIIIDVLANGEVVDQFVTGETGRFEYQGVEPDLSSTWELRLPQYSANSLLRLEVAEGARYLVEFMANPADDQGSTFEN